MTDKIICYYCGSDFVGEMKKKDLADIAVRLFNNIDQAEQFNVNELFYHCDNKFLLEKIQSLAETVKYNVERDKRLSVLDKNVAMDSDELEEIFTLIEKLKGGEQNA